MDDILVSLNRAQSSAVTSRSPVLQVLAGPGSGKTKTLSARVAYLIAHEGYEPWNIIVCTFTRKAALEMKERIGSVIGPEVVKTLILGTFHTICRRYLARFGQLIGLDENFGIADTSDTKAIINRIIARQKLTTNPQAAQARISALKSQGISATQHAAQSTNTRKKAIEAEHFATVYSEYEEELHLTGQLDFDDLLLRCVELLNNSPHCVANIEAVLIDEFQDTNDTQYRLMRLFSQANNKITIVGDPDQSIYGWRNAKIENLNLMRQHYPDNQVVNLEENYRSSALILLAAEEVIQQDQSRPAKSLTPTLSIGMSPVMRDLLSAKAEAAWLVSEMQRTMALSGGLLKWSDYAVLLRSAFLSRKLEIFLGNNGIPYRMIGGHKFYDRVEVKMVLDYLRVIDRPDHSEAVARIMNTPSRMIGELTLQNLREDASNRKITLWTLVLAIAQGNMKPAKDISPQAQRGLERFVNLILVARKRLEKDSSESLADFIKYLIDRMRLKSYMDDKFTTDFEGRWENVQELVTQAGEASSLAEEEKFHTDPSEDLQEQEAIQAEQDEDTDQSSAQATKELLSRFLANVALTTDVQKKTNDKDDQNYVTLSTMHAAKGLEWPVVFIPFAYDGSIPHSRSEDTDEERRLLYVAMTRAQALLYISYPIKGTNQEESKLSPFLSDRKVMARMVARGGNISFDDVRELAQILRRKCPGNVALHAGRKNLEHLEDDQRPRFGIKLELLPNNEFSSDRDALTTPSGWMNARSLLNPGLKGRNRVPLAQSNAITTFDQRGEFSESKALFTSSFTTARKFHEVAAKENVQPSYVAEKRPFTSTGAKSTAKRKKSAQPVEGRASLASWLTKRPP
ncbi:MAG: hypothetical protein M1828_001647 [Chrysothrix sp. TS-e1954]|nr:MAG: hypothetical protein M1828_001647 [Chrysothrix sp. TS-e1954]